MKNKSFYNQLPKEIMLLFAGEKLRNYFFEKDFSRIEAPTFELSQKTSKNTRKVFRRLIFGTERVNLSMKIAKFKIF